MSNTKKLYENNNLSRNYLHEIKLWNFPHWCVHYILFLTFTYFLHYYFTYFSLLPSLLHTSYLYTALLVLLAICRVLAISLMPILMYLNVIVVWRCILNSILSLSTLSFSFNWNVYVLFTIKFKTHAAVRFMTLWRSEWYKTTNKNTTTLFRNFAVEMFTKICQPHVNVTSESPLTSEFSKHESPPQRL